MAAESSVVSGIAGRYATALFDLARDSRTLDAVAADLDRIGALIADSPELTRLVRSPVFGRDEQAKALLQDVIDVATGKKKGGIDKPIKALEAHLIASEAAIGTYLNQLLAKAPK